MNDDGAPSNSKYLLIDDIQVTTHLPHPHLFRPILTQDQRELYIQTHDLLAPRVASDWSQVRAEFVSSNASLQTHCIWYVLLSTIGCVTAMLSELLS